MSTKRRSKAGRLGLLWGRLDIQHRDRRWTATQIKNMSSFKGQTPASENDKEQTKATCTNPGNPIFSCTTNPKISSSNVFQAKPVSILFKTTSGEYGALHPTYEMAPCYHYPVSQKFSEHLGTCGMYRNNSLNTGVDRNKVHDCINLHNTL